MGWEGGVSGFASRDARVLAGEILMVHFLSHCFNCAPKAGNYMQIGLS